MSISRAIDTNQCLTFRLSGVLCGVHCVSAPGPLSGVGIFRELCQLPVAKSSGSIKNVVTAAAVAGTRYELRVTVGSRDLLTENIYLRLYLNNRRYYR